MCGIVGHVTRTKCVDASLIERMCARLEHRGPDSRGCHVSEHVGLGIQRLRVIDLETGDQPIYNEDRSVVVVLNGEIYNYKELREQLRHRGHIFTTEGDTEVIAHLYEEHGAACVTHLHGMFAFAVWDTANERLVLARDRIGKKPLVYSSRGDSLWFASEIPALLEAPDMDRTVDLAAIDSFLRYQYVPSPRTAFESLKKLPPAHTLVWQSGDVSLSPYWRLSFAPRTSPITEEEAQEEIRRHILRATSLRLRSDVPVGAFLSGGIDSSAVVAAMARESSTPVKTFSIGFDVAEFDETAHAREVAALYGTDHHEFVVEPHAAEILPKLVAHFGEPFADNSAIPTFYVARLARKQVTVALNGDGGDEAFGGYGRYLARGMDERLAPQPSFVRAAARMASLALGHGAAPGFRSRMDQGTRLAQMPVHQRYEWRMAYVKPEERSSLYSEAFRCEVDAVADGSLIEAAFAWSEATDLPNRLMDVDIHTYLPNALLVKMDITSMANSLEVRSPLLDHVLMEFAAGLPGSWKVQGARTKHIFRNALRPWLPDSILERSKWGFGSPVGAWLRGPLADLPRDVLLDRSAIDRGWFREDAVRALIDDHAAGRRDNATRLWALLQLELWLRTYVDTTNRPQTIATAV